MKVKGAEINRDRDRDRDRDRLSMKKKGSRKSCLERKYMDTKNHGFHGWARIEIL